jgi:hypothetical protein
VEDDVVLAAELLQREAEQHREQQHLQDLALGEGVDHAVRDDVEQEVGGAGHLARRHVAGDALGVQGGRVDVHAGARLQQVHQHQADEQGDGGEDLEVQQGQAAGLADLLHVLHAGDAQHHGAEDDRGDDHLDQLDEAVTQRLHLRGQVRREMPQQHAHRDGEQHLHVQGAVERGLAGAPGRGLGGCGHGERAEAEAEIIEAALRPVACGTYVI